MCIIVLNFFLQSEMKLFGGSDTAALKQHFGKKIMELEDEKRTVQVNLELVINQFSFLRIHIFNCWLVSIEQQERDRLLTEVENLAANSDGQTQKLQDSHTQKLKTLEAQVTPIFLILLSLSL